MNKSYKQKAILSIKYLCGIFYISIPKINMEDSGIFFKHPTTSLDTKEIRKKYKDKYEQGLIIGQIRSLVDLFNLTDKDFE